MKGDNVGSSSYVVYQGTGTSVTVTNLDHGQDYVGTYDQYTALGRCYNGTEEAETFSQIPYSICK